jgi:hypothetical protein
MYDTVKLNIGSQIHEKVIDCLTNRIERKSSKTQEVSYFGNLENMDVYILSNGITVNGSLGKFIKGNNIERLSRMDVKNAIEKLSDLLGLSINQASVWRLDFGSCFVMERPIREYLSFLGEANKFSCNKYGNGNLQYINNVKAMVFYDKAEEMRKKRQIIPLPFQGMNILRYEIRFTRRLVTQFGEKIKAFRLFEEDFYNRILGKWKNEYFKICRLNKYKLEELKISNGRELKNQLALMGLKGVGGVQDVIEMLDCERAAGKLNRYKHRRLRHMVKSISEINSNILPNERIIELDEKVREVV